MFVYSLKGSTVKWGALILFAVIIIMAVLLISAGSSGSTGAGKLDYPEGSVPFLVQKTQKEFSGIKTGADRISFLQSYGWNVEEEAFEVAQVVIPNEFDSVYSRYNELQKGEGLDLSKYKGKTVKRYTYIVKNYDYNGTVYANILVYKDKVIGGDICSADSNGFIHGLTRENSPIA
ncbi:MAG: DUF4830 domain-containing protein [Ruminococcaceae bacterium]|nr:DUF4830 domain-containing protein [Oscillospiraceae bacterium]